MRGHPLQLALFTAVAAWGATLLAFVAPAFAEDPVPGSPATPTAPVSQATPSAKPSKPALSKGRNAREKEAEGSEARDRFQADTVIKSKYEIDGEPLEVDPD